MAVQILSKRKGSHVCGECGEEVAKSLTACGECGSEDIKKSLVVVRKAVGDEDDDLETAVDEHEDDGDNDDDLDDDLDEDDEEDDDEDEDEEDEDDEDEDEPVKKSKKAPGWLKNKIKNESNNDPDVDDDEDEEDEDEDEEDDDLPRSKKKVKKSLVGPEVMNVSTALASDITKLFTGGATREGYEEVMTEFNNVMDAAADQWFSGSTVSKSGPRSHEKAVARRVSSIFGKEITVAKSTKISKRDDLPEDVRKSLERADAITEEREVEKWEAVAKGYTHVPGDKVELAKSLRTLSETDPAAYDVLKKSLDAAQENLAQSDIFKSYGRTGDGEPSDRISKRRTNAQKLVDEGKFDTIEQAEVHLMDAGDYSATAAV